MHADTLVHTHALTQTHANAQTLADTHAYVCTRTHNCAHACARARANSQAHADTQAHACSGKNCSYTSTIAGQCWLLLAPHPHSTVSPLSSQRSTHLAADGGRCPALAAAALLLLGAVAAGAAGVAVGVLAEWLLMRLGGT